LHNFSLVSYARFDLILPQFIHRKRESLDHLAVNRYAIKGYLWDFGGGIKFHQAE